MCRVRLWNFEINMQSTNGQRSTLGNLKKLVDEFESALRKHKIEIERNSNLEAACLCVTELLDSHLNPQLRNPRQDTRQLYIETFGLWTFMAKIVRLHNKSGFAQFIPHLELLNEGTIGQNKSLQNCEEESNKIFELLIALVLLDIGNDIALDHPQKSRGDNPDVLVTLNGKRWGFACKTVYGTSGKTFFDNIKSGTEQIENSEAEIGCVVINFRNLIDHNSIWPIKHRPDDTLQFGSLKNEDRDNIPLYLNILVSSKSEDVAKEIGVQEVWNFFSGKKTVPGFLAFCQSAAGIQNKSGVVIPSSILKLTLSPFRDLSAHEAIFSQMNNALHERIKS
jgi:hypothetical protein